MGQQNVAFRLLAVIDHHVHHIAGLYSQFSARAAELLNGHRTFGFIPEIDDGVLGGNLENRALANLALRGRQMGILVEQRFVAFAIRQDQIVHLFFALIDGHYRRLRETLHQPIAGTYNRET